MTFTKQLTVSNGGGLGPYAVPSDFPFANSTDVSVSINSGSALTVVTDYTWSSDFTSITFTVAHGGVVDTDVIKFTRSTNIDNPQFLSPGTPTADEINRVLKQAIYSAQETQNLVEGNSIRQNTGGTAWDAETLKIDNAGSAGGDSDSLTTYQDVVSYVAGLLGSTLQQYGAELEAFRGIGFGANGQYLQTNGVNTVTWGNISGISGGWGSRQAILTGASAYLGIGSGLNPQLTASASSPLVISLAEGFGSTGALDQVVEYTANSSWSGITPNVRNYLGVRFNGGSPQLISTEVEPEVTDSPNLTHHILSDFEGSNGATAYTDPYGNVFEFNGSADIDTSDSKFGSSCADIGGKVDGNWIKVPTGFNWQELQSWTCETFFKINTFPDASGNFQRAVVFRGNDLGTNGEETFLLLVDSVGNLQLFMSSFNGSGYDIANGVNALAAISLSTWHHIVIQFDGSKYSVYVDGTEVISVTSSTHVDNQSGLTIGGRERSPATFTYNGDCRYDGLRISPFARYSGASITVPTAQQTPDYYYTSPLAMKTYEGVLGQTEPQGEPILWLGSALAGASTISSVYQLPFREALDYRKLIGKDWSGPTPEWTSNSQITIKAGANTLSTNGLFRLEVPSDIVVDLASSGAGGLDDGTEAADTFYEVWLHRGLAGYTATFSVLGNAPVVPRGYGWGSAKVPLVVRNDSSSHILAFDCPTWGNITYREWADAAPFEVLNAGTSTTWANVDCSSIIPSNSMIGMINFDLNASSTFSGIQSVRIRKDGTSSTGAIVGKSQNSTFLFLNDKELEVPLVSSVFEYMVDVAQMSLSAYVLGFKVVNTNN